MQKAKDAKTAWELKTAILTSGLVLIGVVIIASNVSQRVVLKTAKQNYNLTVASTLAAQEKGLGGRKSLAKNSGMLFIFSKPEAQCIWMKGMYFPIDVLWLGTDKKVQFVEHNLSPSTYPKTFCPNPNTKYVIELNAGQANYSSIGVGQTLNF